MGETQAVEVMRIKAANMQDVIHVDQAPDYEFGPFLLSFGVQPPYEIVPLTGGTQNQVYRIVRADADHLVMVIYGENASNTNVSATLACMNQLNVLKLPVPHVLPNKDELLVQPVTGIDEKKIGTVMTFLPGEPLGAQATEQLVALAQAQANMHHHTGSLHSIPQHQFSIDSLAERLENLPLEDINKGHAAILHNALKQLKQADFSTLPKGLIHGDLFADNCLFFGRNLSGIIDFDFCGLDYFAFDIAIAILGCIYTQNPYRHWAPLEDAYLQAYQEVRPLEEAEIAALKLMKIAATVRFALSRIEDEIAGTGKRASRELIEILTLLSL